MSDTVQLPSQRAFANASALLFVGSAAVTFAWCGSMSEMPSMPMPGGWTMSMTWMRMPGQSWPGAAAAFCGMWAVMMVAMMLPSLVPMLGSYRQSLTTQRPTRIDALTAFAAAGYFCVWTICGLFAFVLGVALMAVMMQSPALSQNVPLAGGAAVVLAGLLQFTAWKARQLECCRPRACGTELPADPRSAWRHGLRLGRRCIRCCAGHTALLLVLGVMDLRVMAAVTVAITLERRASKGARIARLFGALLVIAGAWLILRALSGAPAG